MLNILLIVLISYHNIEQVKQEEFSFNRHNVAKAHGRHRDEGEIESIEQCPMLQNGQQNGTEIIEEYGR